MIRIIKSAFFLRIVLPAMLAIFLFIISVYAFIIPAFENNAIVQKKNMLNELTNTAWSILQKYNRDAEKGLLTIEEAQKKAISEIEALRYGPDKKDYFWITDLTPTMIMHPYVHELNGKSLQDFTDPDGKKIFIEALTIAQKEGQGYISYKWQLKDDPSHIVPKLSFVKKFAPWNWIIGTGIYLHDVEIEISKLTNKLLLILLVITFVIILIIFFVTIQSLNIDSKRRKIEQELLESKEKYKSLIESSTEGIVLLLNSKISYANSFIQNWLLYTSEELLNNNINLILSENQIDDITSIENDSRFEVKLSKKDGTKTDAILTALTIHFADKEGLLLTFKDTNEHQSIKSELEIFKTRFENIFTNSNLGFFRFFMDDTSRIIDHNAQFTAILGYQDSYEFRDFPLSSILANKYELKILLEELNLKGKIQSRHISIKRKDSSIIEVLLSLYITNDLKTSRVFCDGVIDYHPSKSIPSELNKLSQQLLNIYNGNNQSIKDLYSPIIQCPADTSVQRAIEFMNQNNTNALLLHINQGIIGIITRNDIFKRIKNIDTHINTSISEFMTSPLVYINSTASISDAVYAFEKENVSHLIIKDSDGILLGILDKQVLNGKFVDRLEIINTSIQRINHPAEYRQQRKVISQIVQPLLLESGIASFFASLINDTNDLITNRIIQNAINQLGNPPVSFAFISIGSAGRKELTFNSDQDNAIIFDDSEESSFQENQNYFLQLSNKICQHLDESGLAYCKGGFMANNPKWCQPLSVWKSYFKDWIVNAEPVNILNISVFFDFRLSYGDEKLFNKLEKFVFETLKGRTAFYYFLAQSVNSIKHPINVFGNLTTETIGNKNDAIDIKNCTALISQFVRIYALFNNIREKNTLKRIEALRKIEVFSQASSEELIYQYNFFMQLRIQQQIENIQNNEDVSNAVVPKKLSEMNQVILKKVLVQMNSFSERLSANFMSAYKG